MVFRRRNEPLDDVDPSVVSPRRRGEVVGALDAAARFASIVARAPDGPVRQRLESLTPEVHAAVRSVRDAAVATDERAATLGDLSPDEVARRLKDARRQLARAEDDGRPTDTLRRTAASLDRQLGSVHAVWDAVERAEADLHRLQLRLGEVVALTGALAAEISVAAATSIGSPADAGLDQVADELRSLRAALEELGG